MKLTNKERAYLSGIAANYDAIIQIGKEDVSPEVVKAIDEALEKRELIKVNVLKNCFSDLNEIADTIAGRTRATVVRVIGRKIIFYRRAKKPRIEYPKNKVKNKKWKVNVLKNCFSDLNEIADTIAGRTRATVVRVIGRKIIFYRRAKKPRIEYPKNKVKNKKWKE